MRDRYDVVIVGARVGGSTGSRDKGRRACAQLLDRLRGAPASDNPLGTHRLVLRATTAPPG
jgi:DNA-binding LacI/PurR family transcriptional regulator